MLLSDMLIKKPYMYKIKKAYYTNILNKLINIIFLFFIFERFDSEGNGFIHIENITIRNTGKMKISTNSRWRDMLSVSQMFLDLFTFRMSQRCLKDIDVLQVFLDLFTFRMSKRYRSITNVSRSFYILNVSKI